METLTSQDQFIVIFSVLMYNQEVTVGCFDVQLYPHAPSLHYSTLLSSYIFPTKRQGRGRVWFFLTKQINDNVVVNSNNYRNLLYILYNNRAFVWENLSLVFQSQYRSL